MDTKNYRHDIYSEIKTEIFHGNQLNISQITLSYHPAEAAVPSVDIATLPVYSGCCCLLRMLLFTPDVSRYIPVFFDTSSPSLGVAFLVVCLCYLHCCSWLNILYWMDLASELLVLQVTVDTYVCRLIE